MKKKEIVTNIDFSSPVLLPKKKTPATILVGKWKEDFECNFKYSFDGLQVFYKKMTQLLHKYMKTRKVRIKCKNGQIIIIERA